MSTQVERFLAQAGAPFNYTELIGRVPAQILTDAALKIENINSSSTTIEKYNIQQEVKDKNFKKYVGLGILAAALFG